MARLGPPFLTPKTPRKSLCVSLFCVLSQERRDINFFLGAQDWGSWVGAKKFMLKKLMCFFRPYRGRDADLFRIRSLMLNVDQKYVCVYTYVNRERSVCARALHVMAVEHVSCPLCMQFHIQNQEAAAKDRTTCCGHIADHNPGSPSSAAAVLRLAKLHSQ